MEVNDWTPGGKESFTTPGGPFRRPPEGSEKVYSFTRPGPAPDPEAPRPQARREQSSPFAPEENGSLPWYAQVESERPEASQPVVLSHDGEQGGAAPGPQGPVYTVQLPGASRPAPPKKQRSLWWVPLVLLGALLLGAVLGALFYRLRGAEPLPLPDPSSVPTESGETAANRIYREYVDAVVRVTNLPDSDPASSYVTASTGTGFFISEDGYLLTNGHVVSAAGTVTVSLSDGRELPARLVALERSSSDLALLKVEAQGLHPVNLGSSADAKVGDWVCTIGNPLGELSCSLTAGYISAGPRQVDAGGVSLTMLQTNAAINHGNSGGPLFDERGQVIGVVTAKLSASDGDSSVEGLGFALPIDAVKLLAQAWMTADRSSQVSK